MKPDNKNTSEVPDVEAIIADIRRSIDGAGAPSSSDCGHSGHDNGDLHANLEAANRACSVGYVHSCSPSALLRRAAHRVLGLLIGQINEFNARVIRVLNRLAGNVESQRTDIRRLEERLRKIEEKSNNS
jgi:hypothetical protein